MAEGFVGNVKEFFTGKKEKELPAIQHVNLDAATQRSVGAQLDDLTSPFQDRNYQDIEMSGVGAAGQGAMVGQQEGLLRRQQALGGDVDPAMSEALAKRSQKSFDSNLNKLDRTYASGASERAFKSQAENTKRYMDRAERLGALGQALTAKYQNDVGNYKMDLQNYNLQKQKELDKAAARGGALKSILGLGGTVAGAVFGGPAGAAIGGGAGQMVGGAVS